MVYSLLVLGDAAECYIANKYTQARKRLIHPYTVSFRSCECANGVERQCKKISAIALHFPIQFHWDNVSHTCLIQFLCNARSSKSNVQACARIRE
ncbi:hypothetical protein PRIPAC_74438 [Pristionchus pacificus]|uniref:Uncharacterized protein n=1 Tax=Pristionchus pacificus TaxID=54126 RepID=A0A2A6C8W2_PRIPA|nr:hypothetical protein PRIPAC_74438 [Pristionchus pacificus]|eukprot:PDM74518.1 hypothetical protein PRIPAC_41874 [Pristionchus pacificus]